MHNFVSFSRLVLLKKIKMKRVLLKRKNVFPPNVFSHKY